ncbi:UNKNOWN [Stylonychia lemnae]|uniref:Secreted protein n=1 Tax=Stylonychia lemnae TaxID=5949 RepID=A0A078AE28_STYLE|nr:UNKNOWN [Stylonychia lemnae]|eukprot:CDW79168.1 UNKNOWN [Stylonychia lemnae]
MPSISFSLRCLVVFGCVLFLNALHVKNQLQSSTEVGQDSPPSPIAYYKDIISWFAVYGLFQYYGNYCQQYQIVSGQSSISRPGFLFAYFTCDVCKPVKDSYLQHPIGLIFAAADRPQRAVYLEVQNPSFKAYRCY